MLNDVHAPPLDPDAKSPPAPRPAVHRTVGSAGKPHLDRAHELERAAGHSAGTDLVFSDPEDRGDSFNTTMSAIIVGGVLTALVAVAWLMWK